VPDEHGRPNFGWVQNDSAAGRSDRMLYHRVRGLSMVLGHWPRMSGRDVGSQEHEPAAVDVQRHTSDVAAVFTGKK
jgi:hypothetical protein